MLYSGKLHHAMRLCISAILMCSLGTALAEPAPTEPEDQQRTAAFAELSARFMPLIGAARVDVWDSLELSEQELKEVGVACYLLPEPQSILDNDFVQALMFDSADDTLYGVRYTFTTEDAAVAANLVSELLAQAEAEYGAPDTYPGLDNRIVDIADMEVELSQAQGFNYCECWEIDALDDFAMYIKVGKVAEECTLSLSISYQLYYDRNAVRTD